MWFTWLIQYTAHRSSTINFSYINFQAVSFAIANIYGGNVNPHMRLIPTIVRWCTPWLNSTTADSCTCSFTPHILSRAKPQIRRPRRTRSFSIDPCFLCCSLFGQEQMERPPRHVPAGAAEISVRLVLGLLQTDDVPKKSHQDEALRGPGRGRGKRQTRTSDRREP